MRELADKIKEIAGPLSLTLVLRILNGARSIPYEMVAPFAHVFGYTKSATFTQFVELVAMANLLRGLERYDRVEGTHTTAGNRVQAVLRKRMTKVARRLR